MQLLKKVVIPVCGVQKWRLITAEFDDMGAYFFGIFFGIFYGRESVRSVIRYAKKSMIK